MFTLRSSHKSKVVAGGFNSTRSYRCGVSCLGIGLDRVLVFGLSSVMISIKSIDVHIGHESSVGVCFSRRDHEYIELAIAILTSFSPRFPRGGGSIGLVLVFAAMRREMALRSVS